ncbi:MAG TPA: efflux RND transporter permease subunit [Kofleriaceae bacterium]|nr:efflux RND transporter permease subunit [Kofleriaceae bacterium]
MWIVRLALRRPYTFVVVAILIVMFGVLSILRTPKDVFPRIDIPVVSIVWSFAGLDAEEMANRIVTITERALTTTVDNIQHIESQSLDGVAVVKLFLHERANVIQAIAQVTAVSQTQLRALPTGTTPPLIITYTASTVPVLQLGLSGNGLSEQQLFDLAINFIRTRLITVSGAAIPYPYGGRFPQVMVDLNPAALQAKGLSPIDVVNAINAQNLILPAGTVKIGELEYNVDLNGSPTTVDEINNLPIKTIGNTTIYIRDVAWVRFGYPPQINVVRVDGQRSVLITIQKAGNASTLDVVDGVKAMLPSVLAGLPPNLQVTPLADQSLFVRGAVSGVVREGVIAACLTAFMILVFLGNWRSTLIIAISIPLAILTSIIALSALGETINVMTLGGLALAVGILVDDATVEIENINRQAGLGKPILQAILDGAAQIAVPAFVSTLSICIVFVPMFFLTGVARYLFIPLAEAVVFAMLASYLLSRTLVPTMARYLLRGHEHECGHAPRRKPNVFVRVQRRFEHHFENLRGRYRGVLMWCLGSRALFLLAVLGFCLASIVAIVPVLGQDFFPAIDSGQFRLHVRARTGTRIEDTARLCDQIEKVIRERIPPGEVATIIDNIGLPVSGINLTYSTSAPVGPADADILVSLKRGHQPTAEHVHDLRIALAREFPGTTFSFTPADIVGQILNFGQPSPIDIQIGGRDVDASRRFATMLLPELRQVPGLVDTRIQQPDDRQGLFIAVDRTKASQVGLTQRDVATNLLTALSGSSQVSPTFWLNPKNGVSYSIATQAPQYRLSSLALLQNLPIVGTAGRPPQILGNLSTITRRAGAPVVSHYDVTPVIDIFAAVQGRDLGGVARDVERIIDAHRHELPKGTQVVMRGQVETMRTSYVGLLAGLAFAIVLVYLLMVVNVQSWLEPFIIITALPAALAGIAWMLFVTQTTLSVPALMGAIMCMGVATANSILVVTFASEQLRAGKDARTAVLEAGYTRFRPVIMTALAMIIGMVPMAFGLGEGGEQNAPLGRAVIGGLLLATVSTLLFVPTLFSVIYERMSRPKPHAAGAAHAADRADGHEPIPPNRAPPSGGAT